MFKRGFGEISMPVVIDIFGYKIYFWSNEGKPLEPIHVHVSKKPSKNATKIWLLSTGKIKLANNNSNISKQDLKRILWVIESYHKDIKREWILRFKQIKYYDTFYKNSNNAHSL